MLSFTPDCLLCLQFSSYFYSCFVPALCHITCPLSTLDVAMPLSLCCWPVLSHGLTDCRICGLILDYMSPCSALLLCPVTLVGLLIRSWLLPCCCATVPWFVAVQYLSPYFLVAMSLLLVCALAPCLTVMQLASALPVCILSCCNIIIMPFACLVGMSLFWSYYASAHCYVTTSLPCLASSPCPLCLA